jgi:hypothetical protein
MKDAKQTSSPELPFKLGQLTIYIFLISHTIKCLIVQSRLFKSEMFTQPLYINALSHQFLYSSPTYVLRTYYILFAQSHNFLTDL